MTHKASVLRYAPLAALIGTAGRAALSGRGPTAAHGAWPSGDTDLPGAALSPQLPELPASPTASKERGNTGKLQPIKSCA